MFQIFLSVRTKTRQRFIQLTALLIFSLSLAGCLGQSNTEVPQPEIIKSPTDTRNYLAFELENRLKVLVISDPTADKAAAALNVAVGSGSDPKDREGLAHFLEHMLFLGTAKYPEAGAYQHFISEHGGTHNAYTAFDETNYFFDVNATDLQATLDQFAQFFIAPLFNAEYVEREKHAVHSEYQTRIKDDSRLQYDVLQNVSNPAHPFAQFSIGSLETLADQPNKPVRDDLLAFYQQHYSANLMTLVVLGKESPQELRQLVQQSFAGIPNHNSPQPEFKQPLFTKQQLPLRVNSEPNKNLRKLVYYFPIPTTRPYYQSKPIHYITNLLGHEGQGSLLSYLKQRGWADSLGVGIGFEDNQQANLEITIGLTEQGLQQTDAITSALFQTLTLIRQQGVENWRYQEQSQLASIDFKFQQVSNNMNYVTHLASQLQHVPAPQVLSAPYQMQHFNAQLIERYLSALRPDNMLMMLVAKGVTTNQYSRRFNVPYATQKIPQDRLQSWQKPTTNPAIKLPEANPFIPANLSLLNPAAKISKPVAIAMPSGISLWHQTDIEFQAPRADFYFTLRSPLANQSARNVALTALYVKTVNEQLNEFSYPATLAGLDYQLYPHVRGVSVRISGYQDKQPVLLDQILRGLVDPSIKVDTFARHKDELLRGWENALKQTPYQQSLQRISTLITTPSWTETQLIAALEPLQPADLQIFSLAFINRLNIEVMANGNISHTSARQMADQITHYLKLPQPPAKVVKPRIVKLPEKQSLLYQFTTQHPDNAVTLYAQGIDKSINSRALFALLNQIMATPFYHELRTRQQLGYIVFSSPMNLMDVPALAFTVQSPNTQPAQILSAIENFIGDFYSTITTMDAATLATHKHALISQIVQKDSQLSQRSNRYWNEIDRSNFQFDTREQLAAAIRQIDLPRLTNSYRQLLLENPQRLVSLAVGEGSRLSSVPGDYRRINESGLSQLTKQLFEP